LGVNNTTDCQFELLGYNLGVYLFGANITGICSILFILIAMLMLILAKSIPIIGKLFTVLLIIILAILWFIVGITYIHSYNSDCVVESVSYFGYSGLFIILAILTMCALK